MSPVRLGSGCAEIFTQMHTHTNNCFYFLFNEKYRTIGLCFCCVQDQITSQRARCSPAYRYTRQWCTRSAWCTGRALSCTAPSRSTASTARASVAPAPRTSQASTPAAAAALAAAEAAPSLWRGRARSTPPKRGSRRPATPASNATASRTRLRRRRSCCRGSGARRVRWVPLVGVVRCQVGPSGGRGTVSGVSPKW